MKKFFKEFKEFISRGSVMDLAVGIIIGSAFTAIVNSLVNDLIMPIVGGLTGGMDFSEWFVEIGKTGVNITYGNFIGAIINFVIIAFVIFILIKTLNKMSSLNPLKQAEAEPEPEPEPPRLCPYCRQEVDKEATRCPHCTAVIIPGDDTVKPDYGIPES